MRPGAQYVKGTNEDHKRDAYWIQVKQSHYRPGQDLRVPGRWGSQISRQSAHEGGKVVSPMHWPPLPTTKYTWYSFVRGRVDPRPIAQPEGLRQWKIPTPSGIKPATVQLVAQCLNQLRHHVPPYWIQTPCKKMSDSRTMEWRIAATASLHSEHNWIYLEEYFTHETSRRTPLTISLLPPHILCSSHFVTWQNIVFFKQRQQSDKIKP
jgi:hypothetical protein